MTPIDTTVASMRQEAGLFTVAEISSLWGVPVATIYAAIKRGDLNATLPKGAARPFHVTKKDFFEWYTGGHVR